MLQFLTFPRTMIVQSINVSKQCKQLKDRSISGRASDRFFRLIPGATEVVNEDTVTQDNGQSLEESSRKKVDKKV